MKVNFRKTYIYTLFIKTPRCCFVKIIINNEQLNNWRELANWDLREVLSKSYSSWDNFKSTLTNVISSWKDIYSELRVQHTTKSFYF